MLVIGQCNRLTRHACLSEQNASCACAVVAHFAKLTIVFSYYETYNQCLVSFSGVVIVLINW